MMRFVTNLIRAFLIFIALCGCSPTASSPPMVTIQFIVTVPSDDVFSESIFITGDLRELGAWSGTGIELPRRDDGTYGAIARLPKGPVGKFKLTRGSMDTVELGANGNDVLNRRLALDADKVIHMSVEKWRRGRLGRVPSATGDVRYHRKFHSKILGNERSIIVWLPPGYEDDKAVRFPVLYMHDGQNVFDDATSSAGEWRADETAARLIADGKIKPIIIVAIESIGPMRENEYTPTAQPVKRKASTTSVSARAIATQPVEMEGGDGERYAQFVIQEVKPFIDQTYRTSSDRNDTAVAGSSLGGLISLHLASKHGDVFGAVAAMSPSLWWDGAKMLNEFQLDNAWMRRAKIWIDMGTEEGGAVDPTEHLRNTRTFHAILQRARLKPGIDYEYREFQGAKHTEDAWAERFDQVLAFLFAN